MSILDRAVAPACLAVAGLLLAAQLQGQTNQDVQKKLDAMKKSYQQALDALRVDYETRLQALEEEVQDLRAQADENGGNGPGELEQAIQGVSREGLSNFGQSTIFDNRFNPAFGIVSDFIFTASNKNDGHDLYNRFIMRGAELAIAGEVDPFISYYAIIHMDEGELELEEAYGDAHDLLPGNMTLKFGRMNVDFGKQAPMHEHQLPYVDKPGVLQEYLGGALRGTGVELHNWFPLGEDHLMRYTVGIFTRPDSDAHVVAGPIAGEEPFSPGPVLGERGPEDLAYTFRLTALFETSDTATLQVGFSALWAPELKTPLADLLGPAAPAGAQVGLEKAVLGFDLEYLDISPEDGSGWQAGSELFLSMTSFPNDTGTSLERESALGAYGYGEYHFDKYWSVGGSVDWFQHAQDSGQDWIDAGAWVTWKMDNFNRLHLEVRWLDDDLLNEDWFVVMVEWSTIIGSHGHGIRW